MKRVIITLATALTMWAVASADNGQNTPTYTKNGNTYEKVKAEPTETRTKFDYALNGIVYPIFISKNGHAYIKRISKKGNEYRQYLGEEISRDICQALGIEYKPTTK